MIHIWHKVVLFNVLNDEFADSHIGLVPAHLAYRGHIVFSMRTPGLPLLCFQSMQFLKINILQGSVVTLLGVMGYAMIFLLQFSCWV